MSEPTQPLLAAVPLKYTHLVKNVHDEYIFETNTGLWNPIAQDNQLVQSLLPQSKHADYKIIDNFTTLKPFLNPDVDERLSVSDSRANEHLLHLRVDSPSQGEGVSEHLRLLKHYQKFDFKSIIVDRVKFRCLFLNDTTNEIKQELQSQLYELAKFCNVEIMISTRIEYFSLGVNNETVDDVMNQNVYMYVLGDSDDTTFAETRLRILMDSSLGLFVSSLQIPLALVPLIGGMGFGNFKAIAKETSVNLYLPSIIPELYNTPAKRNLDMIFLSGMEAQVLLAKKLIMDIKDETEKNMFYKSIKVLKVKKDDILMDRKTDLSAIMYKHGAFIQISPLGHDYSSVHFKACSTELVELAIADFNTLSNDVYCADLWFYRGESQNGTQLTPIQSKMPTHDFKTMLCMISIAANVLTYASYQSGSFKIVGSRDDCIKAIKLFKSSAPQMYDNYNVRVKFSIELGLAYHEFISGKKNGKIAKIINNAQCSLIDFQPLNEYNLILELESSDFNDFLNSFQQLQQELPSEVKFYIPESFHRQIIGTGGTLIQSIMRKYNVFVKFSNSYDQKNNMRSHVRYDNVIIRCPYKNSSNIPLVQNELNHLLINNENVTFFNTFFKISRNQYRLLNFDKIQEIEKKTTTFFKFPPTEPLDYAMVEVLGTETHSINAVRMIISELAESYEFRITSSPKFHKIIDDTNETFIERIKVPFKLLYKFEVMATDKKSAETGAYHAIILSYPPDSNLFLEEAITHLTAFLREYEFMIIDRGELSNNDLIMNGTAAKFGVNPAGNAPVLNSSYATSAGNTTLPLQLPHVQQLYQLPTLQPQQRFITQPTVVQPYPPAGKQRYQKKQNNTRNGYPRDYKQFNGKSYQ